MVIISCVQHQHIEYAINSGASDYLVSNQLVFNPIVCNFGLSQVPNSGVDYFKYSPDGDYV